MDAAVYYPRMGRIFQKTCRHCHTPFETEGARVAYCSSPKCHLLGRHVVNPTGCHIWQGRPGPNGYGEVCIDGVRYLPHRLAYETFVKPIPKGREFYVCHRGDTPLCINPDHLFLGNVLTNTQDCVGKRRNKRKLQEEEVAWIREQLKHPVRGMQADLARQFDVTPALISRIYKGRCWWHVPGARRSATDK